VATILRQRRVLAIVKTSSCETENMVGIATWLGPVVMPKAELCASGQRCRMVLVVIKTRHSCWLFRERQLFVSGWQHLKCIQRHRNQRVVAQDPNELYGGLVSKQ
jgi:hypothetical protein